MNTNVIKTIEEMTFPELLEFVRNHELFSKRLALLVQDGAEANYMIALATWDESEADISIPPYLRPYFIKYFPRWADSDDWELQNLIEQHDLGFLKAVIESELQYKGKFPKSQTVWNIDFLENPRYSMSYTYDSSVHGKHLSQREMPNDNVFSIEYADEVATEWNLREGNETLRDRVSELTEALDDTHAVFIKDSLGVTHKVNSVDSAKAGITTTIAHGEEVNFDKAFIRAEDKTRIDVNKAIDLLCPSFQNIVLKDELGELIMGMVALYRQME